MTEINIEQAKAELLRALSAQEHDGPKGKCWWCASCADAVIRAYRLLGGEW